MTRITTRTHALKRAGGIRRLSIDVRPWLYLAPAIVAVALVLLFPLVMGFVQGFIGHSASDPFSDSGFVGFANFQAVFSDPAIGRVLANTGFWIAVTLAMQTSLGVILALALNGTGLAVRIVRPFLFIPWAIPSILVGLFWKVLINPGTSFLPSLLFRAGLLSDPSDLLANPDVVLWGPVIAYVWVGIPFFAITTLAALQTIPQELYEAKRLDGESHWDIFWSLTLPLIMPTLGASMLLRLVWISNFGDLVWVMTRGGPAGASQITATYIFSKAFVELDEGAASAMATMQALTLFVFIFIVIRIKKARTQDR